MKKRWLGAGAVLIGLAGLSSTYYLMEKDESAQVQTIEKMSEEEQEKFVNQIADMVSNGDTPASIESEIEKKISGLSKDRANEVLYSLLYALKLEQEQLMESYTGIATALTDAYNDGQFKTGTNKFGKVEDESVRSFLEGLDEQFFKIEEKDDALLLTHDLERIESKYGSFFNPSTQALFDIRMKKETSPYANYTYNSYDLKKNLEFILFIEGKRDVWQDTIVHYDIQSIQEAAYADFFGVTHDAYFEEKDGELVLKESVKDEMWALMKEYANSFMGDDILGFMDELETDDWVRKAEQDFALKRIEERFSRASSVQVPFIQVTAPGEGELE